MSLFYVTLLVLTTLIWGVIFYKKDYHPQPIKVIFQSFGVGLFSMVPVFGYKYLYQHGLSGLSEFRIFQPLMDSPLLAGMLVFALNLGALSLILFILGSLVSLVLSVLNRAVLVNIKNALKQEPLGFMTVSLMIGAVVMARQWMQKTWDMPILATALGSILFLAIIEEYVKHLIVRITDDKKIKDIDDAITLSVIVGLAFAFVETLIYSVSVGEMRIIFFRTMVSLPVHVVASGIFGYFYGLAHFAKPIVAREEGEGAFHSHLWGMASHGWLHRMMTLKKSTVYSEQKIIEGFLYATLFHAGVNLLFELSLGVLAVPIIVLGVVFLFRLYGSGQKESRQIERWARQKIEVKA